MVKAFKYRAKKLLTDEFVFGSLLTFENCAYMVPMQYHTHPLDTIYYEVDKDSIGIFIGLLDKHKKEIYEGDIVRAKRGNTSLGDMNDIYRIVWSDEYACFCYLCIASDNKYRIGKIAKSNTHPFFVSSSITEIIDYK